MTIFQSIDDAISNGFVLASTRTYTTYRKCIIFGFDTSYPGMKGHSYGIRTEVPDDFTRTWLGALSPPFGQSVEVSIGGSFAGMSGGKRQMDGARKVQMFTQQDFNDAVRSAKAWADAWFRVNPEAMARYNERQLQEKEKRRAPA